ncbi:MAG TPA: hypothetical protein VGE97_05000, partial [Nitrososphaera sp.]
MPIVGSQAHSHFIPYATPALVISASFTYQYNASGRVSLSSSYKYDISDIERVSVSFTYLYDNQKSVTKSFIYNYNITATYTGPTRLYFHSALNTLVSNLPTVEQSSLTASKSAEAQSSNHLMNKTIGTSQVQLVLTSNATTSVQNYYFTRFVSEKLRGVDTIDAATWTFNFAARSSSASGNYPVDGTNQPIRIVSYIWRPSTGTKLGNIIDGNSASTIDEATVSPTSQSTTYDGSQVLGVQNGDVICFEVWFIITQAAATNFQDLFYYDGNTVSLTEGTSVSSHASFIETTQGLDFGEAPVRISLSRVYKYNLNARISTASVYKYDTTGRILLSRVYPYSILGLVSLS